MNAYLPLIIVAVVVVAGGVIYALRRYVYQQLQEGGGAAERARRAEADLSVAKRQGEIMTRDEDREDTARSLDDGSF